MSNAIIISVVAVICITVITCVAVMMGHNSALIAASIATIAGVTGGVGAYNVAKARYPQWHTERIEKEDQSTQEGD